MFWNIAHDFVLGVLASVTASIIGPYDMIGFSIAAIFAFIGVVRWHRARVKEGKRGMDSWYFIAACSIVTVIGVGGAAYGIALHSKSAIGAATLTPSGNQFRDAINAYLVRHGNSTTRADDGSIHTSGDETGNFIVYWNTDVLGPWPTPDDGFAPSQVRFFPYKFPQLTLQYDKTKFREAVEDFSKLIKYNAALYRFTNSLMVVRQAEKHPEDGELFEYAMKDLDYIQDEFTRASADLRLWVELVNKRIDLIVKAI